MKTINLDFYQEPLTLSHVTSNGYRRRKQDGRYFLMNTFRSNLVTVFLRYFPVFQKTEHRYFCFSVFVGISQHRITVYDGRSIGIVSVF